MHGSREEVSVAVFGDLVRAVREIGHRGARELAGLGLSPPQFQVLSAVAAAPGCTQQRLGERLGLSKGAVSMAVTRLEGEGLLVRAPTGAAYQLDVTSDGRALVSRLRPKHAAFLADQFTVLDDEELATLAGLLRRL